MAPSNTLPMHGNEKTMNLNSLVLANIQASPYFKVHLYELKTYHQVIDEIYYKVNHLEPWEKGSRKTAGQTGMCGGVRGVGTGGIVSSAFCLLYKLHTLKLTRKQLIGLCNHADSPYIRALGFMYIRFTQPSGDLWEWFEPYLEDEEELDVKAGGGHVMTIGDLVEHFLTKLDWYSTLFPRIAVPVQKQIEQGMRQHKANKWRNGAAAAATAAVDTNVDNSGKHSDSHSRANDDRNYLGTERIDDREARRRPDLELESRASERHSGQCGSRHRSRSRSPRRSRSRGRSSKERRHHSQSHRSQERRRSHSHSRHRRSPPSDRRRSASRDRGHSRRDKQEGSKHHRDRRRTPSVERKGTSRKMEGGHHSRNRHNESEDDFKRDLKKEMERIKREKDSKTKDGQQ